MDHGKTQVTVWPRQRFLFNRMFLFSYGMINDTQMLCMPPWKHLVTSVRWWSWNLWAQMSIDVPAASLKGKKTCINMPNKQPSVREKYIYSKQWTKTHLKFKWIFISLECCSSFCLESWRMVSYFPGNLRWKKIHNVSPHQQKLFSYLNNSHALNFEGNLHLMMGPKTYSKTIAFFL